MTETVARNPMSGVSVPILIMIREYLHTEREYRETGCYNETIQSMVEKNVEIQDGIDVELVEILCSLHHREYINKFRFKEF